MGTKAYVDCYNEILQFEKENDVHFDYIFMASGTGTTQAGLVCGQLINKDDRKIVGISIARKNPRGKEVIVNSIKEYLNEINFTANDEEILSATIFTDDYICDGYGKSNEKIIKTVKDMLKYHGIPLDSTYTAKAFWGMTEYTEKEKIKNKNILFIHTGGTPLFFDDLERM